MANEEEGLMGHIASLTGSDATGEVSREAAEKADDQERRGDANRAFSVEEQDAADSPLPFPQQQDDEPGFPIDQFNQMVGEEPERESPQQPLTTQEEPSEEDRAREGRVADLVQMRQRLAKTNESIDQMRQMMLAQAQQEQARQAEFEAAQQERADQEYLEDEYGEELVVDPAMRFLSDRINSVETMLQEQQRQQQESVAASQQRQEFSRQVNAVSNAVKKSQEDFAAENPDYWQAYDLVRQRREGFYPTMSPEQRQKMVDAEEYQFVMTCLQQGVDPASAVYKMAADMGWSREMYQESGQQQASAQQQPRNDVAKIQRGIQSQARTSMDSRSGRGGSANPGVVTVKEFMTQMPLSKRLEILGDPEKFEALAKRGKLAVG